MGTEGRDEDSHINLREGGKAQEKLERVCDNYIHKASYNKEQALSLFRRKTEKETGKLRNISIGQTQSRDTAVGVNIQRWRITNGLPLQRV